MVKCSNCGSTSWTYKRMVMLPPGGPANVPLPMGEYQCGKCGKTFLDVVQQTSSGISCGKVIVALFGIACVPAGLAFAGAGFMVLGEGRGGGTVGLFFLGWGLLTIFFGIRLLMNLGKVK